MNVLDQLDRLIEEDRLAHAYVIQGDPLSNGKRFAVEMLTRLFQLTAPGRGDPRHRVESRAHPDVFWVEPASKLRQILKVDVSLALKRVSEKSFEGGWKAVVFLGADRLNPASGNQLLKTLEEPPPNTLLLLVTGMPEQLLTTLRSRCQLLIAPSSEEEAPEWEAELLEILREGPPRNVLDRLMRAGRFRDFMQGVAQAEEEGDGEGEEDEESVDEAVIRARETAARRLMNRRVMMVVDAWYRDVLVYKETGEARFLRYGSCVEDVARQSERLRRGDIVKLLENSREIAQRLETNLPVQVVMETAVI